MEIPQEKAGMFKFLNTVYSKEYVKMTKLSQLIFITGSSQNDMNGWSAQVRCERWLPAPSPGRRGRPGGTCRWSSSETAGKCSLIN